MSWEVRTMQSKTSYFNATLFRKNLTRFWPLWGLASFVGALFPLAVLLDMVHRGWNVLSAPDFTGMYYDAVSAVPVINLVYAALCAMAVWSYLYNARSVGLMHTLPIRREGLFLTNFLSGLSMTLIPYAVTGVLCVVVSLCGGAFDAKGLASPSWQCWVRASSTSPAPPSWPSSPATPLPCRRCTPCSTSWRCCWTG